MSKKQRAWHADPENKKRKYETWKKWAKAHPERRLEIQRKSREKRKAESGKSELP